MAKGRELTAKEKEQGIRYGTYNPTGRLVTVCPMCDRELRTGEKGNGKCGICGTLTCDCCLEDHILENHPNIMQYGDLNDDGDFVS